MAPRRDCISEIEAAADGRVSDIEEVVDEIEWARREYGDGQRFFDFVDDTIRQAEVAAAIEKRNKQLNVIAKERLKARMRLADELYGNPSLGLEAAMVGVNRVMEGGRDSVDARANGMLREYLGHLAADLKKGGHISAFKSGEMDRDIARELWDLSLREPTGSATSNRQAKEIAKIINRVQEAARNRENRAGAWIGKREGYVVRQTHDRAKMVRQGYDAWATEIRDRLDWDAMQVPRDKREDMLRASYEVLVTGVRKDLRGGDESDLKFKYMGPGNLARKESQSRTLVFKSSDDWFDYNERFGTGPINETLYAGLSRASSNTALMQVFGTNPQAMRDTVVSEISEELRSDPGKVALFGRRALSNQFAEIDGSVNMVNMHRHNFASFSRGFRTLQSMAKLGGAFISSITDLATLAAERRYQGRNLMQMWGDAAFAPMEGFASGGEKRRYADLLGVGVDGLMGDFMSRFAAQDTVPGRMAKLQGLFFKLNLLGPWTDAVKRAGGMMLSRDLAASHNKAFGDLDLAQRRLLEQYGFDARKWEVARGAIQTADDGRAYMMPGEVANVRGAMFTGMSQRQQDALREEVALALQTLITDRVEFASPTPGARERAIIRQGLEPGTVPGEALRFIMQFKSFPITMMSRVLGRDIYGHGTKRGMGGALMHGESDLVGLASFIAMGTVLGYVALQAKEMAKGRSPRDTTPETFMAAAMQGGGLGIYGDFMFGQYNRFGNSLTSSMAGPTGSVLEDIASTYAKAIRGENAAPDAIRLVQSNLPFANLFYTKAALDYLVWYQMQEWASPGYLRRMERRIARDNGQEFMFPPSQAIPRGGGGAAISFEGVR